jgi:hypothetical protein
MIDKTLALIKRYTGLELQLCDYFTGVKKSGKDKYFNIILSDPIYESREHATLERFANQYGLIKVEPNGYKRLAIFRVVKKATNQKINLKNNPQNLHVV